MSADGRLSQSTFTGNRGIKGIFLIAHFLKLSKVTTLQVGFDTVPSVLDFMLFNYTDPKCDLLRNKKPGALSNLFLLAQRPRQ